MIYLEPWLKCLMNPTSCTILWINVRLHLEAPWLERLVLLMSVSLFLLPHNKCRNIDRCVLNTFDVADMITEHWEKVNLGGLASTRSLSRPVSFLYFSVLHATTFQECFTIGCSYSTCWYKPNICSLSMHSCIPFLEHRRRSTNVLALKSLTRV